mmetsp:Transcript_1992/g.5297  ORF Transcript_1992/g.5297 Transcript_1992/m.5297 type:complete len:210 (-) Transcript_1992:307-936(-)
MGSFLSTRMMRRGRKHGPAMLYGPTSTSLDAAPAAEPFCVAFPSTPRENSRTLPSRHPTRTRVSSLVSEMPSSSSSSVSSMSIRSITSCAVVSDTFRGYLTRLTHSMMVSLSSSPLSLSSSSPRDGTRVATLIPVLYARTLMYREWGSRMYRSGFFLRVKGDLRCDNGFEGIPRCNVVLGVGDRFGNASHQRTPHANAVQGTRQRRRRR